MRILFIHEVNYATKPIFEMHEFPELLSLRGHDVGFLDYGEHESSARSFKWGQNIPGRYLPQAKIKYFSQPETQIGIIGRLLAAMRFPWFFRRVLDEFDPEIVVSFSVPTSGWQALLMCRKRRIPYVFRALDVSHKIRKSAFSPAIRLAERYIYRKANWVSCNNPAMQQYCISQGAAEAQSSVELPPLDLSHFLQSLDKRSNLRESMGISEDACVILYMGSFFYFSGLDQVLRTLHSANYQAVLVLIGGGEQEAALKILAQDLGLNDRVKFTGYISFSDLPTYFQIADVAINPMIPDLVSNSALPNKVLQYMASGLPVVSTKLEGLSALLGEVEGLKLVETPREVLSEAVSLATHSDLLHLGTQNQTTVSELFSEANSIEAFEKLLGRVRKSA